MTVLVNVFDTTSVERGGSTNDTMYFITLLEQKLGKIRTILTSNTYNSSVSIPSRNPMVEMGSSESRWRARHACLWHVSIRYLPVIRATLRLRYSSTEMVDLAILTGAKTASDMVNSKKKERKKERKVSKNGRLNKMSIFIERQSSIVTQETSLLFKPAPHLFLFLSTLDHLPSNVIVRHY